MDAKPGWRPSPSDVVVAVAFAALSVSLTLGVLDTAGDRLVGVSLGVLHSAALVGRRRWPEATLAAMIGTGLLYGLTRFPPVGLGPAIVTGVYSVAAYRSRRRSVPATAAAAAAMAVALLPSNVGYDSIIGNAVVFGVAWLVGDRQRQTKEDAARERLRAQEMERTREDMARRAVVEERLRIARELHDVVAHAMSVIAVQAGTGRVVIDDAPDKAREALAAIETTSRRALAEMRRLLTVLRADEDGGPAQPLLPAPGLADLDGLVAASVKAGLPVEVRVEGERRDLPAGVDLAAYRILQEALTNVRRHADATRATVIVEYQPFALRVEVHDDGRGGTAIDVPDPGQGQGLVGMRERAALYGGTLDVGPRPGGGFLVSLRLPLGGYGA